MSDSVMLNKHICYFWDCPMCANECLEENKDITKDDIVTCPNCVSEFKCNFTLTLTLTKKEKVY
jgi:hypothetical protein